MVKSHNSEKKQYDDEQIYATMWYGSQAISKPN